MVATRVHGNRIDAAGTAVGEYLVRILGRTDELHGSVVGVQLPAVAAHPGHGSIDLQIAGLDHSRRGSLLPDVGLHQLALQSS